MFRAWLRFLVAYAVCTLAASSLTVLLVSYIKVNRVWAVLREANALVAEQRASEAVRRIERMEPWAARYRPVALPHSRALARAYAAAGRFAESRRVAEEMLRGLTGGPSPTGVTDRFIRLFDPLVDRAVRATSRTPPVSRWAGYDALLNELAHRGENAELSRIAAELLARSPDEDRRALYSGYAGLRTRPVPPVRRPRPTEPATTTEPGSVMPAGTADAPPAATGVLAVSTAGTPAQPAKWAIARSPQAPSYSADGKFLAHVAPATVLDVLEIRATKSGEFAVCRPPAGTPARDSVLLRLSDLDLYAGQRDSLDDATRTLLLRRATLAAQLAAVRAQSQEEARTRNPHQKEYDAAVAQSRTFQKKVEDTRRRHDSATGAARMEYADQLRAMIAEGGDIRLRYQRAKGEWDEWNRRNALPPAEDRGAAIEKELASVNEQVARLGIAD